MKENTIAKIVEFFNDNEEIFNACMDELDLHNGYLDNHRYYCMEELDELYGETKPLELLYRSFYGHDDDTWTTDARGEKTYGEFNPNREYFYYNGYGNLVSSDYKDYSAYLNNYAIEAMSENRCYINSIEEDEELSTLFDALEKDGEKVDF